MLLAESPPEWYSEKAAAIGTYCVASGIYTHLGHPPNITSSEMVTNLALEGLDKLLGACFGIAPDPFKAPNSLISGSDKNIRYWGLVNNFNVSSVMEKVLVALCSRAVIKG